MEAKYAEVKLMDERPRYSFKSTNRDTNSTSTMGTRQNTTRAHGATICRGATANRVGQNDGWMALAKMVRLPRQNLETCKSRKSSLQWTVALIQKLWDMSWDMWEHCNKKLYAGTEIQQQITHSLVNDKIKVLYNKRAQQLPRDVLKFLWQLMEMILQYSLASKQIWLDAVQVAQSR